VDQPTIDPDEVRAALRQLDGIAVAAVALLAGVPVAELQRYGGMPDSGQRSTTGGARDS